MILRRYSIAASATVLAASLALMGCERDTSNKDIAKRLKSIEEKLDKIAAGGGAGGRGAARPRPKRKVPNPKLTHGVPLSQSISEGKADAPVVLVEAFNFKCGHCKRALPTITKLKDKYKDDLKVLYKNVVLWEGTRPLHEGLCAAAQQGKLAEYEKLAWADTKVSRQTPAEQGKKISEDIAKAAGVANLEQFKKDRDGKCATIVKQDRRDMAKFGIRGTPGFYINGRYVNTSYMNVPAFEKLIQEELAKAKKAIAAGTPRGQYYSKHIEGKGEKQAKLVEM